MTSRDANTDLIRALAIGLVLVHHFNQFLPQLPDEARAFLRLGAYGVDLFFVLSGWLIGRLYWREHAEFGSVQIRRFWVRRWLRTIPPYFVVLPVAYLAVYVTRGEAFNWRYLLFLQNYEPRLPFYLVSWSLCVEEHFYLALPVVFALGTARTPPAIALPILFAVSLLARIFEQSAAPGLPFGYAETATHLRFEGLILGVYFSFLSVTKSRVWAMLQRHSRFLVPPMLLGAITIPYWDRSATYYFGYTYLALTWGALLATLTGLRTLWLAKLQTTKLIALSSYSTYLTHSLVLHACVAATDRAGLPRESVVGIWIALVLGVGFAMYHLVEYPIIRYRERRFPARAAGRE